MPDDTGKSEDLRAIARASAGLTYPSESDAAFESFRWPAASPRESARDAAARRGKGGARVEELSAADFFAELEGSDDARRYADLRRTLEARLSGLKVIRVGERKLDVYLIGRTHAGDWAGLHTTSVET
jgi:hypothetical protein